MSLDKIMVCHWEINYGMNYRRN